MTHPGPSSSGQRPPSFVRDVFVNVLANLIAAGVIYLGAVAGGYLERNPALVFTAASFVGLSAIAGVGGSLTLWLRGSSTSNYIMSVNGKKITFIAIATLALAVLVLMILAVLRVT